MPTKNKIPKDYLEREFVITREFAARRDLVFKAWTDAKLLAQWWGPRGFTNPVCHWDARAGQAIHVVMRAPNGADYPMGGEFREVVAPERLVFTSGALNGKGKMLFEFLHTATFVERNGQTLLTLQSRVIKTTAEANKYIGGFEAGMTQSLERLKGLIAKSQIGKRPSRELSLTRIFDAPRALVFAAWTKPEHLAKWCAPHGFTIPLAEGDLRAGGAWRQQMRQPDGEVLGVNGVYHEVVKNELLVFTHAWDEDDGQRGHETVVTVRFADYGKKTRMTFHQGFFASTESRDRHRGGWTQCFERLAELLKKKRRK
jgi:uncharacterized protein YndB with AHSA1/START domain